MTTASPSPNVPSFVYREVIRLTAAGIWLSDEHEISHEPTRRLFAKSLRHDSQGYQIVIGSESKRILVEDTAYFIHRMDRLENGTVQLWVNDEEIEPLVPATLEYRPGRLTCQIQRRGQQETAKFLHAAYVDLLQNLDEDESRYFLRLSGREFTLARKSSNTS